MSQCARPLLQVLVDRPQHRSADLMLFQQVTEPADRGLIRHRLATLRVSLLQFQTFEKIKMSQIETKAIWFFGHSSEEKNSRSAVIEGA